MEDPDLTDAGGSFISALPGAMAFDSAFSFALIRGGHLAITVLGGLQVDQHGHLANWMVPGKMIPGMGGAMDLAAGARRVIVAMQHHAKGVSKIVPELTLPPTAARQPGGDRNGGDRACGERFGTARARARGERRGDHRHDRRAIGD